MRAGVWIPTGQPIIISNGRARDHQHRSWAAYLSGCTFNTYVVNVPHHPMLFAYLDNGRPRSARDALTTAGLDGVANVIASGVRVAQSYDQGAFTVLKTHRVDRPTPAEVLQYVNDHPHLRQAAHLMTTDYKGRHAADRPERSRHRRGRQDPGDRRRR